MQISVTGRHIEITESMRQYAEEKAGRLARFYDRTEAIEVILDHEALRHRVEVLVRTDHKHVFVAQVEGSDFHEAIDLVVDKLGRQLTKHKERHRNRKHPERTGRAPEAGAPIEEP